MLCRSAEALGRLVPPAVFKTDEGREKRPWRVRFPCASASTALHGYLIMPPDITTAHGVDEATVAEVHEALREERGLAPTTIATMLRKMEDKGVVDHRVEGRHFIYRPVISENEVRSSMVGELLDRLFAGDPAALVSHLVSDHDLDDEDLDRLRALLEAAEEKDREL